MVLVLAFIQMGLSHMLDNGVKDINTVKVYHTILAALI